MGENLLNSLISPTVKDGKITKKEAELLRELIKARTPAVTALSALGIGGASALGTYIKAKSIKKQKDRRER